MVKRAGASAAIQAVPDGRNLLTRSEIRAVSQRVEERQGVNLGQGSCLIPPAPALLEAAAAAMREGNNSYTPCEGVLPLREALVQKYQEFNSLPIAVANVLVTCGATGALESVCGTYLSPGDEVIVFDPVYQYHLSTVRAHGGVIKPVILRPPEWTFSPDEFAKAFSSRTKLVLFANPGNPTGKAFGREELECISTECRSHDVLAVVDEVYEYLTYDGHKHISLASLPGMFERTLTLCSAGKTFFITGWRVGWLVGPADALELIGVKADRTYVCAPAPLQYAVADGLQYGRAFFERQRETLNTKRLQLTEALAVAGLSPIVPEGAYYVLGAYRASYLDDGEAARDLLERTGIGAVPGNAFMADLRQTGLLRFCFAIDDRTMTDACARLLAAGQH